MSHVTAEGIEYIYSNGTSRKYWRAIRADGVLATHYGRIGSLGQVTVHHLTRSEAAGKMWDLVFQKERKGYGNTPHSRREFTVPRALLDAAGSTNQTGNGGSHSGLAYALVGYYVQGCVTRNRILAADDPVYTMIVNGQITAYQLGVAALSGISPSDPSLLSQDFDLLAIMAGLTALGQEDMPTPAELAIN